MKNLILNKTVLMLFMLCWLISLAMVSPAAAQVHPAALGGEEHPRQSPAQGPSDPAELESFLDGLFLQQMQDYHIVGAAVAVVKDGRMLFSKGYGYADLDNNIPVDPQATLFKLGSLTKLFTWTAVMQLAEQGRLDLDADVNHYLDFRIPGTYAQPITLKHLMTHTAGFEDLHTGMVTLDPKELAPPREWLVTHLPRRVRPPGEAAAYSNYGAALAGYIVMRSSGQSYSQYVLERCLPCLLHAPDSRRCCLYLVPQPVEPVRLAVWIGWQHGGRTWHF